jgi:hypothetical protein
MTSKPPSNVIIKIISISSGLAKYDVDITIEECQFDTHREDDYYSEHVACRYIDNIIYNKY